MSCRFFREIFAAFKPEKRVLLSPTHKRVELRCRSLARQHGSLRALVGRHDELKDANLSCIYTNHSIRATAVTILDESGFEARHIKTVSGHRNESSVRAYSKTDHTTKRRMSETLTAAGTSYSVPNEDSARVENLTAENINLFPLLTLPQEEHVMRGLHFQTTHS